MIASRMNCAWDTARKDIEKYPTVQAAYQNECEEVTDLAESVLIGRIKDKDSSAAKWWLTRKGIERGFGEKRDITSGGKPLDPAATRIIVREYFDDADAESD